MRILFLHDNFPAQFGSIGDYLAGRGWDVAFGTKREGVASSTIKVFNFKPHRDVTKGVHPYVTVFERAVLNGQAVARRCFELKKKGYSPDVIVAHSGWGPGLFVKDVWPDARYIGYFEWYYLPDGADVKFLNDDPVSEDQLLRTRTRNAPILTDLAACEFGICPTRWQREQFPKMFHDHLKVVHDGILTDVFKPDTAARFKNSSLDLSVSDEVITYVARGMEPYRGFPQFMNALEKVLKARPNAHAVIVGNDRVAYGKKLPEGDSYKKRALETGDFDMSRVHFTGLLPRHEYLQVLQISSVHVYLTVPFVLSWSMMEAMSAGCLLVASDTEPVREIVEHEKNGLMTQFHDADAVADAIISALANQEKFKAIRAAARQTIVDRYSARQIYEQKEKMFAGAS